MSSFSLPASNFYRDVIIEQVLLYEVDGVVSYAVAVREQESPEREVEDHLDSSVLGVLGHEVLDVLGVWKVHPKIQDHVVVSDGVIYHTVFAKPSIAARKQVSKLFYVSVSSHDPRLPDLTGPVKY